VPCLRLDGLQRHAGFAQSGQAGMAQLVTRQMRKTRSASGAADDLVDAGR